MPAPNLDLGPCVVIFDPAGVNLQYEKTKNEVFFRYEELSVPIKEDQKGETQIDRVTTGANCELEVNLTREEVRGLASLFANAAYGANYLKVSNPVGEALFVQAKEVIVKPIINGVVSVTTSEWLHIHRAFPRTNLEYAYGNTTQRTTKAIFDAFPDDASGQQNEIWRLGPAA